MYSSPFLSVTTETVERHNAYFNTRVEMEVSVLQDLQLQDIKQETF